MKKLNIIFCLLCLGYNAAFAQIELTNIPPDITVSCYEATPDAEPSATTTCPADPSVSITHQDFISGNCSIDVVRIWTATDMCGNSTSATQQITVQDTEAPIFVAAPPSMTVECASDISPVDLNWVDNCEGAGFAQEYLDSNGNTCPEIITRTWTFMDICGNVATASQTITVLDTSLPMLSGIPDNMTIECSDIPAPPNLTAVDNCDQDVEISFTETAIPGSCSGSYTLIRTWVATDNCGNQDVETHNIVVGDVSNPTLSTLPGDVTVDSENIPDYPQPTATDNCDNQVDIVFDETTTGDACSSDYTLTRTWTATDHCGNSDVHVQIISVVGSAQFDCIASPTVLVMPFCPRDLLPEEIVSDAGCYENLSIELFDEANNPISLTLTGNYNNQTLTAQASDGNGNSCSTQFQIILTEITIDPLYEAEITHPSCPGDSDGAIANLEIFTACEESFPLTYLWSTGETTEDISNLPAGTYSVTVTNAYDENFVAEFTLEEPEPICIIETITCDSGAGDGSIELDVCGGAEPFSISWNGSMGTDLVAGQYIVTITNDNACSVVETYELPFCSTPGEFSIAVNQLDTLCATDVLSSADPNYIIIAIDENCTTFDWPYIDYIFDEESDCVILTGQASGTDTLCVDLLNTLTNEIIQQIVHIEVVADSLVWPGDTDLNYEVNNYDLLNLGLAFGATGPQRQNASINWLGQEAEDWAASTPFSQINFKHMDTDGNGIINYADTIAIVQNWGESHNFTNNDPQSGFNNIQETTDGFAAMVPFYVEADTLIEGEPNSFPIILGEEDLLAEDIYGLAFTLEYDTAIAQPGTVYVAFGDSWLGDYNTDMTGIHKDFYADGKVRVALTRADGVNVTGFGEIARLWITIQDDILLQDNNEDQLRTDANYEFNISDVVLINNAEVLIPTAPAMTSVIINNESTNTQSVYLESRIDIYPNPAEDMLYVNSDGKIASLEIYDVRGQLVLVKTQLNPKGKIDLKNLQRGCYFIKIKTQNTFTNKKLIVR